MILEYLINGLPAIPQRFVGWDEKQFDRKLHSMEPGAIVQPFLQSYKYEIVSTEQFNALEYGDLPKSHGLILTVHLKPHCEFAKKNFENQFKYSKKSS